MRSLLDIEARLLGPGGPFELETAVVLGESLQVFRERPRSLRALVEQSRDFGAAEYVVYQDQRLSYAEHAAQVGSVAMGLREQFGVGPGDRVAILAANRPEWIVSYWAAVSLGAIAVGLNGWWSGDEIVYGVEDCEPRLLIGDRKRLARVAPGRLSVPVLEMESAFPALRSHAPGAPLPDTPIDEDDPATILYTSGTTGRPKGAVASHRNVICFARLGAFHGIRLLLWNAQHADAEAPPPLPPSLLVSAPLFHISGLYAGALTALCNGLKTVWTAGRFDPVQTMELIEREQITNWGPMGTMAHRVAHHPEVTRYDLSSLRVVGSGGAPVSPELQETLRRVFPNAGASMGLGYGLTESTASLTIIGGRELEAHPRSVGRPLPGVQLEIRDAEDKVLPEGAEGEIHARGPMIMHGYWRNPEATQESLASGRWLRTGDIGCLRDGRLYINSRARDLILRGGENVYPGEIELCLEAHPDVVEAAVLGVPHAELGEEVKAVVVPRGDRLLEADALAAWVAQRLAYYKVPAHWELRSEPLPRNATGKVLKTVLRGEGSNPFLEED